MGRGSIWASASIPSKFISLTHPTWPSWVLIFIFTHHTVWPLSSSTASQFFWQPEPSFKDTTAIEILKPISVEPRRIEPLALAHVQQYGVPGLQVIFGDRAGHLNSGWLVGDVNASDRGDVFSFLQSADRISGWLWFPRGINRDGSLSSPCTELAAFKRARAPVNLG